MSADHGEFPLYFVKQTQSISLQRTSVCQLYKSRLKIFFARKGNKLIGSTLSHKFAVSHNTDSVAECNSLFKIVRCENNGDFTKELFKLNPKAVSCNYIKSERGFVKKKYFRHSDK